MGYVLVTETLKLVYLRVPFLGPLLFNIFFNDLNFFPYMSLMIFDQNHLLVNNDKTQALPLGPCSYKYDIVLNGIKVGSHESTKILRVTLD